MRRACCTVCRVRCVPGGLAHLGAGSPAGGGRGGGHGGRRGGGGEGVALSAAGGVCYLLQEAVAYHSEGRGGGHCWQAHPSGRRGSHGHSTVAVRRAVMVAEGARGLRRGQGHSNKKTVGIRRSIRDGLLSVLRAACCVLRGACQPSASRSRLSASVQIRMQAHSRRLARANVRGLVPSRADTPNQRKRRWRCCNSPSWSPNAHHLPWPNSTRRRCYTYIYIHALR